MTAEYVGTFVPGSELWHAARREGLGASEIAAVVGLSPWESKFSLWHRKAGIVGPVQQSEQMSWGHYLEPAIARRFADEHPELMVKRTGSWRSRERPWQLANPDRLTYQGREPLEIKWSPYADGWGPTGTDEIPVYYRCQVLWQLDVMGRDHAWLAALVGSEYREYRIDYDPAAVETLRKAGQEFMDSLAAGEPPDVDDSTHTYQVLRELHDGIEDRDVEISRELAEGYREATHLARYADGYLQQRKNELLDALGTAKYAVHNGERIARRQPARGGTVALYEVTTKTPKTITEATA